jgi:hypothetical protein
MISNYRKFIKESNQDEYDDEDFFPIKRGATKKQIEELLKDDDSVLDGTESLSFYSDWNRWREGKGFDTTNPKEFLYHSIEDDYYDGVMKDGLIGKIYLTETPEESSIHHPIVLKVNVKGLKLRKEDGLWTFFGKIPVSKFEEI